MHNTITSQFPKKNQETNIPVNSILKYTCYVLPYLSYLEKPFQHKSQTHGLLDFYDPHTRYGII